MRSILWSSMWIAAVGCGASSGGSDLGTMSHPSSALAYVAPVENPTGQALFVLDPSVSDTPRMVYRGTVSKPSWSHDGLHIVFRGESGNRMIDADGSNLHDVQYSWGDNPKLSPDGSNLLEGQLDEGGKSLFIRSMVDGSSHKLAGPDADEGVWSPDGSQVAYVCGNASLCVVNADGTNAHMVDPDIRVVDPVLGEGAQAIDWSPDGAWIAYPKAQDTYGGPLDIAVVSPDGKHKHALGLDKGENGSPSFAPGGQIVAIERFLVDLTKPNGSDFGIWELSVDTGDMSEVVADGNYPAYRP